MIGRIASYLLLAANLAACGGLSHIPDVRSEPDWRPLAAVSGSGGMKTGDTSTIAVKNTVSGGMTAMRGAFVAVFDIEDKSGRLSPSEIDGLTDYLANKVAEGGLFHVVPRDEIKKRLLLQKSKSFKKCYDQSCQIEIGREIAAQKTLTTTISRIGSSCVVTAALFDLRKAATDATASSRGKCGTDELVTQIENIIAKFRGRQK
jgi:hypothetical protein